MTDPKVSIADLEATIAQALRDWNVPGAGVAVTHRGETISARGYGVKAAGKDDPVDARTNFAIGSNTKAFTAACIGLLVEEGRLNWNDPVTQYLPDFALYDPWITQHVTIRDILSHRMGVSDVERFLYNTTYSNAEVVRRLRYVPPAAPFRTEFVYSNIAYMAAGEIIRVLTGESWETMVQERIFRPLGMAHSTTNFLDAQKLDDLALPHVNRYSGLLSMRSRMMDPVQPVAWRDFGSQAAGSITSNVLDMTRWLGMFLGRGTYAGKTVLQPQTVAHLNHPSNLIQTASGSILALEMLGAELDFWTYGLGWFVCCYKGRKLVFHSGQVQGMISLCGFVPQENLSFAILTNVNFSLVQVVLCLTICDRFMGGSQRDWSKECLGLMSQMRKEEEAQNQKLLQSANPGLPPSLPLAELAGKFDHDYFGEHTINLEGDHLVVRFPPDLAGDMEHWQGDEFLIHWREDPFEGNFLRFCVNDDGQVEGFEIKNEGFFKKIEANL